ncbi:MAG: SRPBCC domain-containing protein [Candidatus Kerfeldbacteria bacterium]|nr:SRPBCC domain-containing protein [Candidatus Kerfeldbacteria bacterium]
MTGIKTVTIKQGAMMPGTPHEVFELWMDSTKHAAFTGGEAKISRQVGGSFTVFDGWATGKNVKLVPDTTIVQTWRADDWPAGHFSTITVSLIKAPNGTKFLFTQTDVPASKAKDIAQGWRDYYWAPLKAALAKPS